MRYYRQVYFITLKQTLKKEGSENKVFMIKEWIEKSVARKEIGSLATEQKGCPKKVKAKRV